MAGRGGRRTGGRPVFGQLVKKEMAERIMGTGEITPLEVLVAGMRITWQRSVEEDHKGQNFLLAMAAAERAAPYMHSKIAAVDPIQQEQANTQIRVVVQRLTRPQLTHAGEPELVDGDIEEGVIVEDVAAPQDHYREPTVKLTDPPEPTHTTDATGRVVVTEFEIDMDLLRRKARELRKEQDRKRAARKQSRLARKQAQQQSAA